MTLSVGPTRPALEVAEVIREYGEAFLARHGGWLSATQKKALADLARCRTAALGGHVERCLDCDHQRIAYNSCRNRHCPKCQALSRARWLAREAEHLLPVEYHHVVFTLPAELSDLALANPDALYNALFEAASATLREVAANPQRLGAEIGVLMVLHTWGQNLHHHPHVHCVCSGGGLSLPNLGRQSEENPRWVACRPGFFLPVRVLSRVFRGKYLDRLRRLFVKGELRFAGQLAPLADPQRFEQLLSTLRGHDWVVYAKRPFGGPAQVLKYLARYTHRVAISNSRLLKFENGTVTFRYKDYADAHRHKTMTLSADEFLRRFVQHVLPAGFVKVRHYGLLANRHRQEKLDMCRRLLISVDAAQQSATTDAAGALGDAVTPADEPCCPKCGSRRLVIIELPTNVADTS
jgi:hypothetical protein